MYPPVTQFETRDELVRQQLELRRIRQRAAQKTHAKPGSWRRGLRAALLMKPALREMMFSHRTDRA